MKLFYLLLGQNRQVSHKIEVRIIRYWKKIKQLGNVGNTFCIVAKIYLACIEGEGEESGNFRKVVSAHGVDRVSLIYSCVSVYVYCQSVHVLKNLNFKV